MASHSGILTWRIAWTEEPGGLQSMALQSWTWLSVHTHTHTTSDFLLLSSTVLWLHTSRCYFNFLKQFDFFFLINQWHRLISSTCKYYSWDSGGLSNNCSSSLLSQEKKKENNWRVERTEGACSWQALCPDQTLDWLLLAPWPWPWCPSLSVLHGPIVATGLWSWFSQNAPPSLSDRFPFLSPSSVLSHFSHVLLFATPWTVAYHAPLSMGILQTRILEWVAMRSSRGSSWPRNRTSISYVFCVGRGLLYH